MVIILLAIGEYSIKDIGGYSVVSHWWLLLVIICYITTIGDYCIINYVTYFML
jgi:hypothetical protein